MALAQQISIDCLVVSVLLAITSAIYNRKSNFKNPFSKTNSSITIYILLAGVFVSLFVLLFSLNKVDPKNGQAFLTVLFLSILHTLQFMLGGYNFKDILASLPRTPENLAVLPYLSFLSVIAPVLTFGFVLSFFKNITAGIRYLSSWFRPFYVISSLNPKSIILAESIRQKSLFATIVFTNCNLSNNETDRTLLLRAQKAGAITFKTDITNLLVFFHIPFLPSKFFIMGEDESTNIEKALFLLERKTFRHKRNASLFVFSTSPKGRLLLNSLADDCTVTVRRINENRQWAYSELLSGALKENPKVVGGTSHISIAIIGAGGYGTELAKAILWCSQLPDYSLELALFDKDPSAEQKFIAQCPAIARNCYKDSQGNNIYFCDEFGFAQFKLKFFCGVNVEDKAFEEKLCQLPNLTSVYVALGNDDKNIEAAITARRTLEKINLYPVIKAIVYSNIKFNSLSNHSLINHKSQNFDITFIGCETKRFSYDTITNELLEEKALVQHINYTQIEKTGVINIDKIVPVPRKDYKKKHSKALQTFRFEYNRNSSEAAAIYGTYIANLPKKYSMETLRIYEHMRWLVYTITEGYEFAPETNHLLKQHECIINANQLLPVNICHDKANIIAYFTLNNKKSEIPKD